MSQSLSRSLHRLAVAGLSGLCLGAVSLTAHAQGTLTLTNGYGGGSIVNVGASTYSVFDGDFASTLTGGPAGFPSSFESYCVDLNAAAHLNAPYAVTESSASTLTRGTKVAWLAENALYLFSKEGGNANQQRGALQLAIWNTLYDTDSTVNGGTFKITFVQPGYDSLANLYLSDLGANTSALGTQIVDASGHSYQSLIKSNTPEPGAIAYLTILGVGGLSLLRRRRRTAGSKRVQQ